MDHVYMWGEVLYECARYVVQVSFTGLAVLVGSCMDAGEPEGVGSPNWLSTQRWAGIGDQCFTVIAGDRGSISVGATSSCDPKSASLVTGSSPTTGDLGAVSGSLPKRSASEGRGPSKGSLPGDVAQKASNLPRSSIAALSLRTSISARSVKP